jgi:hypothetical protein
MACSINKAVGVIFQVRNFDRKRKDRDVDPLSKASETSRREIGNFEKNVWM